jgi:hypothetical protein
VNQVQARKLVLVSIFLLAAIAVYRDHKNGAGDTFKALWGVGVVGLALSLLADFAPSVAGPFAGLIVLGSLTEKGSDLIAESLSKISKAPANPNSPATSPTTTAGGTTSAGTTNPARPAVPAGSTPVGGTR